MKRAIMTMAAIGFLAVLISCNNEPQKVETKTVTNVVTNTVVTVDTNFITNTVYTYGTNNLTNTFVTTNYTFLTNTAITTNWTYSTNTYNTTNTYNATNTVNLTNTNNLYAGVTYTTATNFRLTNYYLIAEAGYIIPMSTNTNTGLAINDVLAAGIPMLSEDLYANSILIASPYYLNSLTNFAITNEAMGPHQTCIWEIISNYIPGNPGGYSTTNMGLHR